MRIGFSLPRKASIHKMNATPAMQMNASRLPENLANGQTLIILEAGVGIEPA